MIGLNLLGSAEVAAAALRNLAAVVDENAVTVWLASTKTATYFSSNWPIMKWALDIEIALESLPERLDR